MHDRIRSITAIKILRVWGSVCTASTVAPGRKESTAAVLTHAFRRATGSFLVDEQTALCAVRGDDGGGGGVGRIELENKEAGCGLEQWDLERLGVIGREALGRGTGGGGRYPCVGVDDIEEEVELGAMARARGEHNGVTDAGGGQLLETCSG